MIEYLSDLIILALLFNLGPANLFLAQGEQGRVRGSEKEREGDEEREVLPSLPCPWTASKRATDPSISSLPKESKGEGERGRCREGGPSISSLPRESKG